MIILTILIINALMIPYLSVALLSCLVDSLNSTRKHVALLSVASFLAIANTLLVYLALFNTLFKEI